MADNIVVIQCAGRKQPNAGHLRNNEGHKVMFVAKPDDAPQGEPYAYAHPDGTGEAGEPWRQKLLRHNDAHQSNADDNPLGLLPAWQLYQNPAYELLYQECGPNDLYILSAGWGLIRADFLTPTYDITFQSGAEQYQRRYKRDPYDDFRMLPDDIAKPVVFFGGKDYVGLFCELTRRVQGPRFVFYNSNTAPKAPGCQTKKFNTNTRTNWHYAAARAYVEGHINI